MDPENTAASEALEAALDLESEAEFGNPNLRDPLISDSGAHARVRLSQWTAQDFASLHTRLRPHLERHAKRYLHNEFQAEEVVQEAFLYLMTSLPELDSELGVLKFLKWKVKMLSLDILRSSRVQRETSSDYIEDIADEDFDLLADFERAEDNAVIRLALSKLSPRQREALIASVYEEKSASEIALQLSVSENAARQLTFRARSAFRIALIGEADVQGKTVAQILTVAAKKAALEARKHAPVLGSLILVSALSLGLSPFVNLDGTRDGTSISIANAPSDVQSVPSSPEDPSQIPGEMQTSNTFPSPGANNSASAFNSDKESDSPSSSPVPEASSDDNIDQGVSVTSVSSSSNSNFTSPEPSQNLSADNLSPILSTDVQQAGFYSGSYTSIFSELFDGLSVEVFGGTGISAFLDFEPKTFEVSKVFFQMRLDGEVYLGVAQEFEFEKKNREDSFELVATSTNFYLVDVEGNVFSQSPLSSSTATVKLVVDFNGRPKSAALTVKPIA